MTLKTQAAKAKIKKWVLKKSYRYGELTVKLYLIFDYTEAWQPQSLCCSVVNFIYNFHLSIIL